MSSMQSPSKTLRRRHALFAIGFLLVLALVRKYHNFVASTVQTAASAAKTRLDGSTVHATSHSTSNRTLGFQEIMYISMDGRTDRSDSMLLLSELMGIKVTRIPGVKGDEINPKALPKKPHDLTAGALGCWRAHVDAWHVVVGGGLGTALILEDDADWDVSLKDELYLLSKALAENGSPLGNHEKFPVTATEPYGVGWDMLWLGHCMHDNNKGVGHPGFRYKDSTVPPFKTLPSDFRAELELRNAGEDGYRTVSKAYAPVCTAGYAVTSRGARTLLYLLGMEGPNSAVDLDLSSLTQNGSLQSLLVTPPLIAQWKTGGWQDSEILSNTKAPVGHADGSSGIGDGSARKAIEAWATSRDS